MIEASEGHTSLRHAVRVPALKELVAQITPENCYAEADWGSDVGKEIVEY